MLALLLSLAALAGPLDILSDTEVYRGQRIATAAPPISEAQYQKVLGGEVIVGVLTVPGFSAKKGYAVQKVNVPIEKLWAAVNDDRGKVKYSKLSYTEVFDGNDCVANRDVFQFLPVPMVTDRWWHLRVRNNVEIAASSGGRVQEMFFKSVDEDALPTQSMRDWARKGMRVKYVEGAWYLRDLDGNNTLIEYYTWSDPGGSVPAGLASSFSSSSIAKTLDAMVALANAGSFCTGKL